MEGDIVVEMLLGELLDALDMLGREVGAQLDGDAAVFGVEIEQLVFGARHGRGAKRGDGRGGEKQTAGEFHEASLCLPRLLMARLRASTEAAGAKADTSPPSAAIWRTKVPLTWRSPGEAGRKTV